MSQHKFTGDRSDMAHRIKTEMQKSEPTKPNFDLCTSEACWRSQTLHRRRHLCP